MTRRFLLALLGIPRPPERELRELAGQVDWTNALDLAGSNLHPMMAYRIEERGVPAPDWAREHLRLSRQSSAMAMARRRAETRRALQTLEGRGIPVTVLKGFALAHQVYPTPETRTMSDIDFWIHAGTMDSAVAALGASGWHVPWWADTTAGPAGSGGQVSLVLPHNGLTLELHREPGSLVDTIPGSLDEFWSRRRPVSLGGIPAWTLPAEETLIHLSVHLAEHHRFVDALVRLLDVSLVVATHGPTMDWPSFAARCRELGVSGWVATSLGTAHRMLGAPIPAGVLAAFSVPDLEHLCDAAAEQAWLRPGCAEGPQAVLSAPTPAAMGVRLGRRMAQLFSDGSSSAEGPALNPRQRLRRLRVMMQNYLPGFLRTLWTNVARPAEAARLRRLGAENEALSKAMRGPPAKG